MSVFPQFAQKDPESGAFQQQDADECFQGILSTIEPALADGGGSLIDRLFSFNVRYTWTNTECPDEPPYDTEEILRRLPCIIDNQAMPINQITEGIDVALKGEIEKRSEVMERNCIYNKVGKISTLPDYMIVQKIRFIWKEKDAGTATDARKAKILRCVNFPRILDVNNFCIPELQSGFKAIREKIKLSDEAKVKELEQEFDEFKKKYEKTEVDTLKLNKMFKDGRRENEIKEHDAQLWHDLSVGTPTGNYELIGVITHKGRSADSGHYVGWAHYKGGRLRLSCR
jgi:ubiquitin carboxyl-terminal hydrolase 14